MKAEFDGFVGDLVLATEEVQGALEAGEDARQLAAGQQVDDLVRRWNELKARMEPADKDRVEVMRIDRRVTDVRRAAAQLTKRMSGSRVESAVDAGVMPFLLRRDPPKSIESRPSSSRERPRYTVGGEVEAWCGKCIGLHEHRIVALVGDEPKQVICNSCGSRHGYRTQSARKGAPGAPGTVERGAAAAVDRDGQKRHEARMKLQKELAECAEPRPFDPKGRYKAGEIIQHPEHGRGKIENVLRSSMLVRFLEGLRPVNLS